jgi:ferredoxin--NADP+ reductase
LNQPTMTRDQFPESAALSIETITYVHHWCEGLFTLKMTRPPSFRFRSGEFVMIGLPGDNGKPLLRAYSVASPSYEEELEFLSIKVQDGPLTSRLQHIQVGDPIYLGKKPTGTLVTDALLPGKRLFMLSTGTGLAPFMSLVRDPEVYGMFEEVDLRPHCNARIVPHAGPHSGADRRRPPVRTIKRPAAFRAGRRPRDAVRQHGDDQGPCRRSGSAWV